jgi:hypothetical protein
MEINRPDIVAEVTAIFERYEAALIGNDVAVLDELFWDSPHTIRFGATENLYGYDAIATFRRQRPAMKPGRTLKNTMITTYGQNFATINTEFHRPESDHIGRQSQTWIRTPEGWRVVSGHVSFLSEQLF